MGDLVEIVKYAGGSARLYADCKNPPPGSFLRLSETEGLLAAGSRCLQGTRNPLLIRVVKGHPTAARAMTIESAALDVFRLGFLSLASLFVTTRLPVTTNTAHKAAYFHAKT